MFSGFLRLLINNVVSVFGFSFLITFILLFRSIYISGTDIYICYSPAGWSVLGETVPEVLSTARGRRPRAVLRPRAQFLPIRPELGRWITFLFFSFWDLKLSGKFYFSLHSMCVEEGHVRVDVIQSARSIANQNKTLQHDFYLVIYIITIKLSLE